MKIQEGEKTGEKRGEISPLHLNYIFGPGTTFSQLELWHNLCVNGSDLLRTLGLSSIGIEIGI